MPSDPTILILFHQYTQPRPAVDRSRFLHHGACHNTHYLPDGAQAGSGALAFSRDDASVKVAMAPHWERLGGLVIDVMLRLEGDLSARRNIVEADGCFAFYVAPGGEVRFDIFSLVKGQGSASWNGVSSTIHAIGPGYRMTPGRWVHLQASFDGVATARIRADKRLVSERHDFRSSLGSPGGRGIAVGNWTLRSQYALHGAIDWLAVRKIDDRAIVRDFLGRVDERTRRAWADFINCLRARNGDKPLGALAEGVGDLLAKVATLIAGADDVTRARLSERIAHYVALWEGNQLTNPAYGKTLMELRDLLAAVSGGELLVEMQRLQDQFEQLMGERARDCFKCSGLAALDPQWARAFERMGSIGHSASVETRS